MDNNDKIQIFEDKKIRTAWNEETEEWYFSVVDVIAVLTDSPNPATYWRVLKKRLKDEGNETVTSCNGLKMTAADGKKRMTDVADTEQLLRIIQSIPSPKAEPFKLWLAEATTTELSKTTNPQNFQENVEVAKKGGNIAGDTRKAIEESTGKPVITSKNAAELNTVIINLIEGIAEDADNEE